MAERFPDLGIDPRSGYIEVDLVRMFLIISKAPTGRRKLIERLSLGEATVKTMIKFMKSNGLINQGTRGIYPSKKCMGMFSKFETFSSIKHADIQEFPNDRTVALMIKGHAKKIETGIMQRDEGVKYNATVISLAKRHEKIEVVGCPEYTPEYASIIEGMFKLENGDAVIISAAESIIDAERGVVSAAVSTVM